MPERPEGEPLTPARRPDEDGGRERLFYRDIDEFNKVMDAAAESIRKSAGPRVFSSIVWIALLGLLATCYVGDWAFDLDFRHNVIPGVDLVKPLWAVIVAAMIVHHGWSRNQHARIVKNRLCLECGTRLVDAAVDGEGTGTCPKCDRRYNLGEYRAPSRNRGRGYQGYMDEDHFDRTMYAAAEHLSRFRGLGLETTLFGWCWLALGVSFGVSLIFGWNLLDWLPGQVPGHGLWFVVMLVWSGVHSVRMKRMRPSIIDRRLCMECGFCLLRTPTNDQGIGRCSECGSDFATGQYQRPAPGKLAAPPAVDGS